MLLWLITALLTVVSLAFILRPLWRWESAPESDGAVAIYKSLLAEIDDDEKQGKLTREGAESARAEVARRLLRAADQSKRISDTVVRDRRASRLVAYGIVLGTPAIALTTYLLLGTPGLPGQPFPARGPSVDDNLAMLARQIEERLAEHPDEVQGWRLLAVARMRLGQFPEAVKAYERVLSLAAHDEQTLIGYVQARLRANDGRLDASARAAIREALDLAPTSPHARYFAALDAWQHEERGRAREIWSELLIELPDSDPLAAIIRRRLDASIAQ